MIDILKTIAVYQENKDGIEVENFWDERTPAGQLIIAAEYIVAALILEPNNENGPLLRPKYMLACQAIELAEKSALLIAGAATPSDLRKAPLNHDLARLLDRCQQLPDFPIDRQDADAIRAVAPAMSAFNFRYGLEGGSPSASAKLQLPPLIHVVRAANNARELAWRMLKLDDPNNRP